MDSGTSITMHVLEEKLKGLSCSLLAWGRYTFGNIRKELRDFKRVLADLRAQPDRVGPSHQELKVVECIFELQHREETLWRQRSRMQWLSEGDRNTRFFHMRASRGKKKNRINRLARPDGSITKDTLELSQLTRDFHHIHRSNNQAADTLANIGSLRKEIPPGVGLEKLHKPSITPCPGSDSIRMPPAQESDGPASSKLEAVEVLVIDEASPWTLPFLAYLANDELPADELIARQIKRRANAYTIINNELYKRSVSGIFQRCVSQEEGVEILKEIHQGECGHHASAKAIVAKAFRHGFYWPTARADANQLQIIE